MSQDPVEIAADKPKLYSSTMLMAAGTLVSRALGAVRVVLAGHIFLNISRQADMFNQASSIPSTVYMLLAGGILNAILVPQLMRAMSRDADGGQAFSDRIVTLFSLLVAGLTLLLVVATPLVLQIMVPGQWRVPELAAQYQSMMILTALCLPQVLFFGLFFLGGQILNARGSFGPLMWAPALNNVIQVVMLGAYAAVWGFNSNTTEGAAAFSGSQILVLGLGSVFGVLCQALILIPFLKKVGFKYRPRFDFFHTGLGSTANMAKWVLALVAIDQVCFVVVNRLSLLATAGGEGAGATVFNNAMLISLVPHAVFTVSLATALLPSLSKLSAMGQWDRYAAQFLSGIRIIYAAMIPIAVLFATLGVRIGVLVWPRDGQYVGWTLAILGIGLIPSTLRFLTVKAFNAMENTRTPFMVEIAFVGITCLVSVLLILWVKVPMDWIAPSIGLGYTLGYLGCGVLVWLLLRRAVPGLTGIVGYTAKLIGISAPGGLLAWAITWLQSRYLPGAIMGWLGLVVAGCAAIGVYWGLAKLTGVTEIIDLERMILTRLRRSQRPKEAEMDFSDESTQPILTGLAPLVPGALIAGRYRLVEMIATIGVAKRWTGVDEGLSRPVFITAFPNDEAGGVLLEAARQASTAMDARFWRILDAGQDADGGYIISERAESITLATVLQSGPLSGEESAWLVREVAAALANIHTAHLYHCRIDPSEIYVTNDGAVKIAGLGIDQALTPRAKDDQLSHSDREAIDVVTCGGLLYACLTATWPGATQVGLPASPRNASGLQSPAQAQPGTSPALDRLTYQIMSIQDPAHLGSAHEVEAALTTILGPRDAQAGLANRAGANRAGHQGVPNTSQALRPQIVEAEVLGGGGPGEGMGAFSENQGGGALSEAGATMSQGGAATPAGAMPAGAMSEGVGEASGGLHREVSAPKLGLAVSPDSARVWSRVFLVLVCLVVVALVTAVVVGLYNSSRPVAPPPPPSPAELTTRAIEAADIFDSKKDGGSGWENDELVPLAHDGNVDTAWPTEDYDHPIIPDEKPGVGLVFDLGEAVEVSRATITINLMPVNLMVYAPGGDPATVTEPDMSSIKKWTPLGGAVLSQTTNVIDFQPVRTRYLVVYFTKLAELDDGVTQADLAEVSFAG